MTKLAKVDAVTRRETLGEIQGRNLMVELRSFFLRIREKGRHQSYDVSYEAIFHLAAKKEAERVRAEKAAGRKKPKKVSRSLLRRT